MKKTEKVIIKPNIPWLSVGASIFCLGLSIMFFTSRYFDLTMGLFAVFLFLMSLFFFWITDRTYLNLNFEGSRIKIEGYFSIRQINLHDDQIIGYELNETVNQFEPLHKQIGLRTKQGNLIIFPKVAYSDYSELFEIIMSKYALIEDKPLKNAKFYNKWVPIIGTISGLLALLVGLMKILK